MVVVDPMYCIIGLLTRKGGDNSQVDHTSVLLSLLPLSLSSVTSLPIPRGSIPYIGIATKCELLSSHHLISPFDTPSSSQFIPSTHPSF